SDNPLTEQELFVEAMDFGRKRGWKYLECRGTKNLSEKSSPSLSYYGHVLTLGEREDRIFGGLESSVRRAIRKAENAKIQVEVSQSLESLLTYYSMHCKTRKKHGLPPQSPAFFRNIFEHVLSKGLGCIVVASQDRKSVV